MESGGLVWCVVTPAGSVRLHQALGRVGGAATVAIRAERGGTGAKDWARCGRQAEFQRELFKGRGLSWSHGGCADSKECGLQDGRGAWARPALFSRREAPRQVPMTGADPASPRFKSANQAWVVLGTAATGVAVFGIGFVE